MMVMVICRNVVLEQEFQGNPHLSQKMKLKVSKNSNKGTAAEQLKQSDCW